MDYLKNLINKACIQNREIKFINLSVKDIKDIFL